MLPDRVPIDGRCGAALCGGMVPVLQGSAGRREQHLEMALPVLLPEAQRPAAVRLIFQDLAPHQGESLIQVAAPASGHQRIEPVEIDVGLLAIEAVGTGLGQQDPTGQAKALSSCRRSSQT